MALSDTIVLIVAIIILIIAGVLNILAAQKIKSDPNYASNVNFQKARGQLIWASVIIWVGLVFVLITMGISFYFNRQAAQRGTPNTISKGGKYILIGMIIFTFILILISGVLSILAAQNMKKSTLTPGSSSTAYSYSIGAAITTIAGMTIALLIYLILIFIRKPSVAAAAGKQYTVIKEKIGQTPVAPLILTQPVAVAPVAVTPGVATSTLSRQA